jgi:hypothetical protein
MTSETLEKHVEDWTRILMPVVPVERLDECFLKAYREKKAGEYFEAAHISQAWYSIRAEGVHVPSTAANCPLCQAEKEDPSIPPCPFHPKKDHVVTGR